MTASLPDGFHYQGLLYRALNPRWQALPLSGDGAKLHGGRFNPKGMPALYLTLRVETALREANQAGHLQPTTVVAYRADIEPIFDGTDISALAARGLTQGALAADDWRIARKPAGQALGAALAKEGYMGLKVPSYVRGAGVTDINMVLFTWPKGSLTVIDDEGRLQR